MTRHECAGPSIAHVTRLILMAAACLATALPSAASGQAPEIIQAQVLDLTVLEVQVIVTGARGTDEVRCLLRDGAGRTRTGGARRVASGAASGRTTVVSVPLPLLAPDEREFAVTLARGEAVLDRTDWRPLFRRP